MFWEKRPGSTVVGESMREFPPMPPPSSSKAVKEKMHEMLLAALRGGVAYEDAKKACEAEFGGELSAAQHRDEIMMKFFNKQMEEWVKKKEERDRERYNGY